MSVSTELVRREGRALERSEIERRRMLVARWRWIESNLTCAQIADALQRANPPIVVSVRTVERDCDAIRNDARRYLTATHFDGRHEIGTALLRYELLARKGTQRALVENGKDAAKWARVAILATEAKTTLLQHVGLIDRRIGTLLIDDGQRADRIPSGEELQQRFAQVNVVDGELVSRAELAWKHGDQAAYERAARDASHGIKPSKNGDGDAH
jgi:hypothetical protein